MQFEIDNGAIRASFTVTEGAVAQEYSVRDGDAWLPILRSLAVVDEPDESSPLYQARPDQSSVRARVAERLTTAEVVAGDVPTVRLSGEDADGTYEQIVRLPTGEARAHVEIRTSLSNVLLDHLLSCFTFAPGTPDFVHTPCLKQDDEDVISDRTFYSPAAVLQRGGAVASIVPDLDALNAAYPVATGARPVTAYRLCHLPDVGRPRSVPTIFDVDLAAGVSSDPVISFGYADTTFIHHVRWQHANDGSSARSILDGNVSFAFDILLDADAAPHRGFRRAAQYIWDVYGRRELALPRPQIEPFEGYADVCFPAAFGYRGDMDFPYSRLPTAEDRPLDTWQEFDLDGTPMGGLRAGPAQWYYDIQFMAWWNNARDAVAMYRWGKRTDDPTLVDKAKRTINLALTAPQNEGLYPAVYSVETGEWTGGYWGNFPEEYDPESEFHVWDMKSTYYQLAAASKTAAHLLRYRDLCEDDGRILPYVISYGDFLLSHMQDHGDNGASIPAFFNADLEPTPWLEFNAEGGIHAWTLVLLYNASGDIRYLDGARKFLRFLDVEILPQQRWYDQETFYSCARKPEGFYDHRTGQPARNSLSMIWAVDAFTEAYKSTGDEAFLQSAEVVADYMSFYQASWQPHFIITAYAFGGMGTQNTDCEWLDMRQAQVGEAFLRVALASGRQDMLERAIAAVRAQFAIVHMPTSRQNLVIATSMFPIGVCGENIDHEGTPAEPLRSGADWGEVGGLAAAATLLDEVGTIYGNVATGQSIGVDGFHVDTFTATGGRVEFSVRSLLEELQVPPGRDYRGDIRLAGLNLDAQYELIINGATLVKGSGAELASTPVKVVAGMVSLA